ncbi:MAG: hypothetical protein JW730_07010 [Anaerolineales bacterium]|nr:hypothetical protein [Anaerolineales bacterium]
MKFDPQQRLAIYGLAAVFLLFIGTLLYFHSNVNESRKITSPVFSTSTAESELASKNGWWTSMPTDPSLPTMPAISLLKAPPTGTPTCTPIVTLTPKESK